jgi:hypothetical protein
MAKHIVVTDRIEKENNDKRKYAVIEVSTPSTFYTRNSATGEDEAMNQQPQTVGGIVGFEESYLLSLKGKPDYTFTMKDGEKYLGDIVARNVEPYFIADATGDRKPKQAGPDTKKIDGKNVTGRMVNSAKVLVLGNTDEVESFELAVVRAFAQKGYKLLNRSKAQNEILKAEGVASDEETAKVKEEETAAKSK